MKQPFVNLEEKIDRFVGRRTVTPDSLKAGMQLQAAAVEFHRALKHRWDYAEAAKDVVVRDLDGVPIPLACSGG